MHRTPITAEPRGPAVEAFLLGKLDFDLALALQQRLVFEISGRDDGRIALLVCEHDPVITVGRRGSRGHIRIEESEMLARGLDIRWVNRGDGVMVHLPGQVAVYPIVPLEWHGFTVGDYLDRLQAGLCNTLSEYHLALETRDGRHGIWGRSGQLAAVGIAVKSWTTYHGAFINVRPEMGLFGHLDTDPEGGTRMGSLVADRRRPVKMTTVRADVVRHLAAAFECDRFHVYTGHPLLSEVEQHHRRKASRVG